MNDPNDNKSAPQPAESPRQPGWRSALLLAAILTLVGAGAATLAGFGARHGWQLELFCHFRVQYFWALALACTGFAVLGRRVLMLVAAALAAANLVLILPLYFGPDATANDSTTLRALELNVHFLNQNYDATLDLIRRDKPDIVVLCEITPGWKEALKALDKEYPYSEIIPSRSPAGLALLSRYQITDIAVKTLSRVGLPTIVAGLETPDGRLTVIATHPASPSTATDFKYRNEQLAEVGRIAGERAGPVMVLGDLNTTGWSPFFQDMLEVSGLVDSRRGFGVAATWPSLLLPLRIPIDHCLVSPEVSVGEYRVGPSVGSDHRPIVVDFAF